MDPIVLLALLLSAFLHASWHAAARTRPAPGEALTAMITTAAFWGFLTMLVVGPPQLRVWPYLVTVGLLNVVVTRLLVAAYERTAFVVAYPAARAAISPLVLVFALIAFAEWPRPGGVAGILAVCAGVALLAVAAARRSRVDVVGLLFALASAAMTALYVMVDALAVRSGADAFRYAAGATVTNATVFFVLNTIEGRRPLAVLRREWKVALAGSAASSASYLIYIWSMLHTSIAAATSIREMSVFFSITIGALWLKEQVQPVHWIAGVLAVAGIALIRFG